MPGVFLSVPKYDSLKMFLTGINASLFKSSGESSSVASPKRRYLHFYERVIQCSLLKLPVSSRPRAGHPVFLPPNASLFSPRAVHLVFLTPNASLFTSWGGSPSVPYPRRQFLHVLGRVTQCSLPQTPVSSRPRTGHPIFLTPNASLFMFSDGSVCVFFLSASLFTSSRGSSNVPYPKRQSLIVLGRIIQYSFTISHFPRIPFGDREPSRAR